MQYEIDFLRHGETTAGAVFIGTSNACLSSAGFRAMSNSLAANTNKTYQQVLSSPLRRCLDFAKFYSQQQQLPLSIVDHWQELNFGDWENKSASDICDYDCTALSLFWRNPFRYHIPNGETLLNFQQRVSCALENLISSQPPSTLVISHAGVIRMLIYTLSTCQAKNIFEIQIPHASLNRLHIRYQNQKISITDWQQFC